MQICSLSYDKQLNFGFSICLEESIGLISALIPPSGKGQDLAVFNASAGALKLGPAPILRAETERRLREISSQDTMDARPTVPAGLISPTAADMLPRPPLFKTVDVRREVERVRDERKRLRLEPSVLAMEKDPTSSTVNAVRARALPGMCAYTLYDIGEGYVALKKRERNISRCIDLSMFPKAHPVPLSHRIPPSWL